MLETDVPEIANDMIMSVKKEAVLALLQFSM